MRHSNAIAQDNPKICDSCPQCDGQGLIHKPGKTLDCFACKNKGFITQKDFEYGLSYQNNKKVSLPWIKTVQFLLDQRKNGIPQTLPETPENANNEELVGSPD